MREIKFRAWNKYHQKMFNVECIDFINGLVYCVSINGKSTHTFGMIDVTREQFTGLLDKNGKEIYEGDIVCVPDSEHCGKWAVRWHNNQYNITPYDTPAHLVIGNIHESPELLEA